jgi:hypothetical protein
MLYTLPRETLVVVAASQSNPEALAVRVVLAQSRTAFHPCMCGLRGGAAMFAAALIDYDDHGGWCRDDHKEEVNGRS